MIKAVFFDLDGVLINSEHVVTIFFEDYNKLHNLAIPKERLKLVIGSHPKWNPWAKVIEGFDLDLDEYFNGVMAYRDKRLSEYDLSTLAFNGAKELLAYLKNKGIKLALASSSKRSYVEKMLKANELYDYFDLVVVGDDFTNPKPDPEIYLYCAKKLNVKCDEAVVIEDSMLGIQAAKNAGIKVIAKKDHEFGLDQSQADVFIEELLEIKDLI